MKVPVTFAVAVLCFINAIVYKFRKLWVTNNNFSEVEKKPLNAADKPRCRRFSLAEIKSATDNFSDALVIGRGGFGNVYKGLIDEGKETVAIKRLRPDSRQGQREFWTEIEMLSELRHVNLVSLIGYCNEEGEMILVYDHMPRGTLADYLYKRDGRISVRASLSWKQRLMICIGAGRGLDYLHTGHRVIHRDVKPSNILLDENLVAKFSDFGLAKIQIGRDSQTQESTNLKGTFGFIDPEFFRTRTLTRKSDTYSFGVVLLEVLCGRKAIDRSLDDDRRSLTVWARENISKGDVDVVMDPRLRGHISPGSLKAFLNITERCLDDVPKKRPRISHVVMNLEFALELQGNVNLLVENRESDAVDIFPCVCKIQQDTAKTWVPNEKSGISGFFPRTARFFFSGKASSNVLNVTAPQMTKTSQIIPSAPPKGSGKKTSKLKFSQFWPFDVFRNKTRPAKMDFGGISRTGIGWVTLDDGIASPLSLRTNKDPASRFNGSSGKLELASHYLLPTPNLKVFSFSELRKATRNFRPDSVLGEGGFGRVYKGWLSDGNTTTVVAIKLLSRESAQGLKEWETEVTFLGRLSHPNLVKLVGYCREEEHLLLVYEYMEKGSLDNHLFRRGDAAQTLSWDTRLKILIGAARGLAFLHGLENQIIYRDVKTSNILLDESYEAKLSDFGLAKHGPGASESHVSTRVVGTIGYMAPEYALVGRLYVKSDVYGFGVCVLEMLTGLRSVDRNDAEQIMLMDWVELPSRKRKLEQVIDRRLEGKYSLTAASLVAQLALDCIESDPKRRPPMKRVVEILERAHSVTEKSRHATVRFVST